MPEKETLKRAQTDKREGKAPTTQAGEFIREEIHHVREGKHGARSTKQAIAIGLSKARRAGVRLPPPEDAPKSVRRRAAGDLRKAKSGRRKTSRRRARATMRALKQVGAGTLRGEAPQPAQPLGCGQEGGAHAGAIALTAIDARYNGGLDGRSPR